MFRLLGCLVVVAVFTGCGPEMDRCESDLDCLETQYCVSRICVERSVKPDAGTDAGVIDAGTPDAGTTQPTPDAGTTTDAGVRDAGVEPACELHDTRACCGGRGEQTCVQSDGGPAWDECDATKTSESCNGIDDDCDGTIDDEIAWVAPDGGIVMSLECSVGVGACASSGVYVCNTSGAPVCGATVVQPTAEVCDGADNDCDGAIDEGTTIACLVDADNDRYAAGNASEQQLCPDTTRGNWGNCPVGFVAPNASVAVDCDDTNAAQFRNVSVRTDGDGDAFCVGTAFSHCVGATVPAGLREPMNCEASDDCDDGQSATYQVRAMRSDADGDRYCLAGVSNECVGAVAPAGKAFAETCNATADCDDTSAAIFRVASVKVDVDNDASCVGQASDRCIGNAPPSGLRLSETCGTTSDCNDTNGGIFRSAFISRDGDNDGFCLSASTDTCIGNAPPAGYRLTSTCAASIDCDDSLATAFRTVNMYADQDGDRFCAGVAVPRCVGAAAVSPGYLPIELCSAGSDCADTDASRWRNVNLRRDQDGDGFCSSAGATTVCMGSTVPNGYRNPTNCNSTDDVIDTNAYATSQAELSGASSTASKECGTAPPAQTLSFSWSCPTGFHAVGAGYVYVNPSNGVSEAQHYPQVSGTSGAVAGSFQCKFAAVGRDTWAVSVTCRADGL